MTADLQNVKRLIIRGDGSFSVDPKGDWVSVRHFDKALAEIERQRGEIARLEKAVEDYRAVARTAVLAANEMSSVDVPAERACKGGGKCPEPTWCSQEQACLWDRWNK